MEVESLPLISKMELTKSSERNHQLACCLLNVRSIGGSKLNDKVERIKRYVTENRLDLFAVTETMFKEEDNYSRCVPAGYWMWQKSRVLSNKGDDKEVGSKAASKASGGVALMFKEDLEVVNFDLEKIPSTAFEHLTVRIRTRCGRLFLLGVIYSSPSVSDKDMKSNFELYSDLMYQLEYPIMILGDFNVHTDTQTYSSMYGTKWRQHVPKDIATHKDGNTLDHVVTRNDSSISVTPPEVRTQDSNISDHFPVHFQIDIEEKYKIPGEDEKITRIIPNNLPDRSPSRPLIAIETTEDGNCLYRAVSYCMQENEDRHAILRQESAKELEKNTLDYLNHPFLLEQAQKHEINTYLILGSCFYNETITNNNIETLIKKQAKATKEPGNLLHILALSTVLQKTIILVHPSGDGSHHGVIQPLPRELNNQEDCKHEVCVMWCNAAGDTGPINHFVPLITKHAESYKTNPKGNGGIPQDGRQRRSCDEAGASQLGDTSTKGSLTETIAAPERPQEKKYQEYDWVVYKPGTRGLICKYCNAFPVQSCFISGNKTAYTPNKMLRHNKSANHETSKEHFEKEIKA